MEKEAKYEVISCMLRKINYELLSNIRKAFDSGDIQHVRCSETRSTNGSPESLNHIKNSKMLYLFPFLTFKINNHPFVRRGRQRE